MFYIPAMVAFFISLLVLFLILNAKLKVFQIMDLPNARSLHNKPIPRSGGVAIMMGVLISWALFVGFIPWAILTFVFVAVSLIDDFKGLSAKSRLLIHLIITYLFLRIYLPEVSWYYDILIMIGIAWMVNLYNFMDGSDGLAGGMAIFGFSAYAVIAYFAHSVQISILSGLVVASSLAFLFFNFHPAKIFMGDTGSIPLGFLAGSIGIYGTYHSIWPLWLPILIFSPFIVDTTLTLIKRILNGEKVLDAHKIHYYQRLVQLGFGHRNTAISEYVLMVVAAASGFILLKFSLAIQMAGLLVWIVIYLLIIFYIDQRWNYFQSSHN